MLGWLPVDNWYLYRSPNHPNLLFRHQLRDGTLNPPGSWRNAVLPPEVGSLQAAGFLASAAAGRLGPYGCTSATPDHYTVGPFGYGDANCSNENVPLIVNWMGVRFNCQVFETPQEPDLPASNLQTILFVVADELGGGPGYDPAMLAGPSLGQRQSGSYPGPRLAIPELGRTPDFAERLRLLQERNR